MEEWKEYKLGEVLSVRYGKDYDDLAEGDYPVFGSGGYMCSVSKYLYDRPSVLIPRVGTLNNVIYVSEPFWTANTMFWTEINEDIVIPKFLYYIIHAFDFSSMNLGSAVPRLNKSLIESIEVRIPSIGTQQEVVEKLFPIDDKIVINQRINDNFTLPFLLLTCFVLWLLKLRNDNLQQQARALYKSWFVDFEPFNDGQFEDSELGLIPQGWSVKQLGEITTQVNERVKERVDVKVLSPITTGELVLSEEYFTKQVFSESIFKYIVVKPTDFAYNPARVNIGSLGMNEYDFDGCVSPVYVVFRCEDEYQHFFDLFRRTQKFLDEVNVRSIGGVRQTLSYKDFSLIKLVYPSKIVVKAFNEVYLPLKKTISENDKEIELLASLRDTLLPKLMSGNTIL